MLKRDPLFKALTRPAMFLGVPLIPFFIALSFCILLGIYTKLQYAIILLPILGILRLVSNIDEKIFQLYGIKRHLMPLRLRAGKIKNLFAGNYYTSNDYSRERLKSKVVNDKGEYTMLDLEKAIPLHKIIPFSSLIAENVILTKDGAYIACWEIEGISYETRNDDELDRYKNQLNSLIRSLSQENVSIYSHNCRLFSQLKSSHYFENEFASDINNAYMKSFDSKDFMENSLFFTIIYKPYKGIDKVSRKMQSNKERLNDIQEGLHHFQELAERIDTSISKFGANRLTSYEENGVIYSQQLEFFNFLLTGNYQKVRVLKSPIYTYLGNIEMVCGKDIAQITLNGKNTFVRGIEIKDWVQETESGLLDQLIGLNCRYVLTQSFSALPKNEAKMLIDRQLKRLQSTEDDSISEQVALEQAKDQLVSGDISFGEHHFTLMIYGDSVKDVQKSTNEAFNELTNLGFIVTLSNVALDEAYFSQLPANFKFRPRTSLISSLNFVGLNSLHNNPQGKADKNCWGNAITLLKTSTSTPFYFNFHQTKIGRNDFGDMHLGHTLILGKSGTGKTVLATFLLSQLMAFSTEKSFPKKSVNKQLTAIYLDKDYGAEIAVRAMGGKYNRLKNGMPTNFNPFMLDNTKENIAFLNELISILVTNDGSKLSVKDREEINFAIHSVMNTPKEYRKFGISRLLENIQENNTDENSLKRRLSIWKQGNLYGWVFDNENDSLTFDDVAIYGFDGTEILDNQTIINPLSFYLLHRVSMILDGRRVVVFLDEFWKWLNGESFKAFVYDGLKTMRKKNGFVIPITQSPDEILQNDISRAIIEQVETFIFLPNSKANEKEYMQEFKVSEKEFSLIKNLADDSRQFLIKKGSENDNRGNAVLARLDLSTLDKGDLKVLSGSSDNIAILDQIIEVVGENPKDWLPRFREEMKRI